MGKLFPDTSPEFEAVYIEMMRDVPGWKKIHMVNQLNARMKSLMQSGLRDRYPYASKQEIRRRMADLLLGPELALEVYGPLSAQDDGESVQNS